MGPRGKLISAVKAGSEWRMPELREITDLRYCRATSHWDDKLSDVPEEYSFLKEYSWLSIGQEIKIKICLELFVEVSIQSLLN